MGLKKVSPPDVRHMIVSATPDELNAFVTTKIMEGYKVQESSKPLSYDSVTKTLTMFYLLIKYPDGED